MTYFPTVMAQYSLFVLKVLLNSKQTNKPCAVPVLLLKCPVHNMWCLLL